MPPKTVFVGPFQSEGNKFIFHSEQKDCVTSNHISTIMLPRAPASVADDKKKKIQTGKKGKSKSLPDISGKLQDFGW